MWCNRFSRGEYIAWQLRQRGGFPRTIGRIHRPTRLAYEPVVIGLGREGCRMLSAEDASGFYGRMME